MGSDQKLNMIHVIISTDKIYYFIFNLMRLRKVVEKNQFQFRQIKL